MQERIKASRARVEAAYQRHGRPMQFMEVCGTHTVSAFRSGIRSMLPEGLRLVSGPGCPVCVTAQSHIDMAIELAARDDVALATYGDMMRVPGSLGSLERLRAEGAEIHVVNSARSCLDLARANPDRQYVFLAVGFETTTPATASVVLEADRDDLDNFSVLAFHKLVVPAMIALLEAGDVPLDGFMCPGHVSVIIGSDAYRPLVERYVRPCVVTGFEPDQIMLGLAHLAEQTAAGEAKLENVYRGIVGATGNQVAHDMMGKVFAVADTVWRALGTIPGSGLEIVPRYARFDAIDRFDLAEGEEKVHPACRCGEVIQGKIDPIACSLFGSACTPLTPIGPCMVSSEGSCAAWHKYGQSDAGGGCRAAGMERA